MRTLRMRRMWPQTGLIFIIILTIWSKHVFASTTNSKRVVSTVGRTALGSVKTKVFVIGLDDKKKEQFFQKRISEILDEFNQSLHGLTPVLEIKVQFIKYASSPYADVHSNLIVFPFNYSERENFEDAFSATVLHEYAHLLFHLNLSEYLFNELPIGDLFRKLIETPIVADEYQELAREYNEYRDRSGIRGDFRTLLWPLQFSLVIEAYHELFADLLTGIGQGNLNSAAEAFRIRERAFHPHSCCNSIGDENEPSSRLNSGNFFRRSRIIIGELVGEHFERQTGFRFLESAFLVFASELYQLTQDGLLNDLGKIEANERLIDRLK